MYIYIYIYVYIYYIYMMSFSKGQYNWSTSSPWRIQGSNIICFVGPLTFSGRNLPTSGSLSSVDWFPNIAISHRIPGENRWPEKKSVACTRPWLFEPPGPVPVATGWFLNVRKPGFYPFRSILGDIKASKGWMVSQLSEWALCPVCIYDSWTLNDINELSGCFASLSSLKSKLF